jgi:hypothetical protein
MRTQTKLLTSVSMDSTKCTAHSVESGQVQKHKQYLYSNCKELISGVLSESIGTVQLHSENGVPMFSMHHCREEDIGNCLELPKHVDYTVIIISGTCTTYQFRSTLSNTCVIVQIIYRLGKR